MTWPRLIQDACRLIERESPKLQTLATALDVSRSELQRQFTRHLGVSPKAYSQALALHRLAKGVSGERTILDAVYEAGFGTSSAGYDSSTRNLGVPPGRLRRAIDIGWWMGLSDLGWMLLGASSRGICWLSFGDQPEQMLAEMQDSFPKATLYNDEARLYDWFRKVCDFVLLPREALDLPVDIQGTAFQSRVWRALREIPIGEISSYTRVAQRIGAPTSVRAVASACAGNRVALLIPCHRVIASDGRLAGYRWGLERKARLLEREKGTTRR